MKNKFRSDLSIAKNLGSAGSGSKHWWYQRFSSLMLLFVTSWLVTFSWDLGRAETSAIVEILKRPYNIIMLGIFVMSGLYHAALGMQVVIEDYVHCRAARLVTLLLVQVFSIVTAISFLIAVLHVMNL
ncbi:MAG: succinate dehydrogenase, hydrophobic membrane anchor protein [Rickettsiales bacterium]|nr:succinate dehydrogenase, hydrophobic membrane anchor protein [Rickettsiales bacterium]MCA0254358.1 succinate dehydrogenase, hydrophobic membrane anchor protein [Pseudomonadota bacterium]